MITVKMDEDIALDMLMNRLEFWIKNHSETSKNIDRHLYEQMYESYLESGAFESMEFDAMNIVDNDYVNYCHVVEPGDDDYEKIDKLYKENGIGDISCEDVSCGNFIESAYEYDGDMYYLIRY